MGKNNLPRFYRAQAARNAERRYLRNREPETKRVEKQREATANVVSMCALIACNRAFGLGAERLQRVQMRAMAVSEQFARVRDTLGWMRARKWLDDQIGDYFEKNFVLPVIVPPCSRKDWDKLHEQRDAADPIVKFYIKALHECMGFGRERVAVFVREVEREYREFGEMARDGDYYGYQRLAREMSRILRSDMVVDESEADEPIFGTSLD